MTAVASTRASAYEALARADEDLARLIAQHGQPDPFTWDVLEHVAGADAFAELVLHVVSQQISTSAAVTIYGRIGARAPGGVTPAGIAAIEIGDLRAAGVSTAKARAIRDLAERVADGRLSFERLAAAGDEAALAELQAVRGIGPWSATMFLLHHLRRPDVFPAADVGLQRGAQAAFGLAERPTADQLALRAERWRPYRSYAAALLWAHARRG
jgi:DNA-3-methyladenine glycosylase II